MFDIELVYLGICGETDNRNVCRSNSQWLSTS